MPSVGKDAAIQEYNRIVVSNIRKEAAGRRYTLKKLEEALSFGNATIAKWEKGKRKPPMQKLEIIADFLGCSLDDLIPKTEKSPSPNENGLSSDEQTLIQLFRLLAPDQQQIVIAQLQGIAQSLLIPGIASKDQ